MRRTFWIVREKGTDVPVRDGLSRLILVFPDKQTADMYADMCMEGIACYTERLDPVDISVIRQLRKQIKEKEDNGQG